MIAWMFPAFVWLAAATAAAADPSEKLLFERNSLYQYIAVVEDTAKKERYIRNYKKEIAQGGIYVNTPDTLLFEYTQMAFLGLAFLDREPQDVLFVGLGAGAMPRYFNRHYPEVTTEVVEIDPDIVDVAKSFFFFRENEKMKVYVNDGRIFIKKARKKYDVIFLDAYQNDYVPFHLTTREFLQEVKAKLKPGGVVVSNITSEFKNRFFNSMVATYDREFPNLYILKGRKSNNFIFIAMADGRLRAREEIVAGAQRVQASRRLDIDLARIGMTCEHCEEYRTKAKVLTDDFAPVNLYRQMRTE